MLQPPQGCGHQQDLVRCTHTFSPTFSPTNVWNLERLHRTTLPFSRGSLKTLRHLQFNALQACLHFKTLSGKPQDRRLLAWHGQQHDDAALLNMSLPPREIPSDSRRIRRPISRNYVPAHQLLATRQLKEGS
ncbi:hypothetical protein HPB50_009379 [Hyalomma asiaticum]|uniref:Uncharacterized protein n=1 Tax=Hyalomma asiaticum TaxID=266040 RepID=A0ACB7SD42_HYAAI|nr:hypothetical protein HPB50_009379 [Hyalomma asiaticum]